MISMFLLFNMKTSFLRTFLGLCERAVTRGAAHLAQRYVGPSHGLAGGVLVSPRPASRVLGNKAEAQGQEALPGASSWSGRRRCWSWSQRVLNSLHFSAERTFSGILLLTVWIIFTTCRTLSNGTFEFLKNIYVEYKYFLPTKNKFQDSPTQAHFTW